MAMIRKKPPQNPAAITINSHKEISSFFWSKEYASKKYSNKKQNGIIALLIQYLKNGLEVVAKKRQRLLCNMNVVIFQLMMKTAVAIPVIAAPPAFTFPMYSGARNNPLAPKIFKKCPVSVRKRINQKINKTWNFLK